MIIFIFYAQDVFFCVIIIYISKSEIQFISKYEVALHNSVKNDTKKFLVSYIVILIFSDIVLLLSNRGYMFKILECVISSN